MDAGYIVRWLPGQGLPHGLRISIGTEEEMLGMTAALRALVEAPNGRAALIAAWTRASISSRFRPGRDRLAEADRDRPGPLQPAARP